jgi:Ca-activated chloride channel family protein
VPTSLDEIAAGKHILPRHAHPPRRPRRPGPVRQHHPATREDHHLTTTLEHALAYLTQPHDDLANSRDHGGTLLYDAIVAVSHLELGNQLGRRAMVILTDGGDNGSRFNIKHAIEEAQRADIMVYTIYYSDGGGDEDVLKDISRQTGGREFSVSPTLTLAQIYADIADRPAPEYELGYRPPDSRPNKYHKISSP